MSTNKKNKSLELATFAYDFFHAGYLPLALYNKIKILLYDQLGLEYANSKLPCSTAAIDYFAKSSCIGRSRIIFYGKQLSAEAAATINSVFGHAEDFDDTCLSVQTHPGAVVIPAVFAVAEEKNLTLNQVLLAILMGYEITLRIADSVTPGILEQGHHTPSAVGLFAVAIATGLLLGLNVKELVNALGIAGSFSSGLTEYTQSGGSIKRFHCAIGTSSGIRSSYLAYNGITGPSSVLDGGKGFLRVFSRQEPDFSKLTNNLGTDWLINRVSLKYFNCCYFIHAPLDAFLTIINENSIHYLDIEKVLVGISKYAIEHVGTIKKPIDLLGAQFSLTYTLAMSVIFGYPKLDSYRELLLDNKEINLLEEKIEIYNDEVAQSEYPYNWGAIVTIFTQNGQSFSLSSDQDILKVCLKILCHLTKYGVNLKLISGHYLTKSKKNYKKFFLTAMVKS